VTLFHPPLPSVAFLEVDTNSLRLLMVADAFTTSERLTLNEWLLPTLTMRETEYRPGPTSRLAAD